jgi:hypothetical protein
MKSIFGSLVVSGSGKLGGSAFSKGRHGVSMKRRVLPIDRKSSSQSVVRYNLYYIASLWRSLSESQRLAWNQMCLHNLSGFNIFCKINSNRLLLTLSVLTDPPVFSSLYQIESASVLILSLDQVILLSIAPTIPVNVSIKVFCSKPLLPGICTFTHQYRLIGIITNANPTPIELSYLYLSKFVSVGLEGQKIFFKLIAIDNATGLESQPYVFSQIVSNIDYSNVGLTWSDLGSQSAQSQITRICYLGNGVCLAGTSISQAHILRSNDFGLTWIDQGQVLSMSGVFSFDTDKLGTVILGLGSSAAKIARSLDFGLTWSDMGNLPGNSYVYSMLSLGSGMWLAGVGLTTAKVYRSLDNGLSWSEMATLTNANRVYWLCNVGNGVLLAATGVLGRIHRSINNGSSWSEVYTCPSSTSVYNIQYVGNGVCLASGGLSGHIYRSVDYGLNWSDLGNLGSETLVGGLCNLGNGVVIAGTQPNGSIFRSVDYGASWSDLGQMFGELRINALAYMFGGTCLAGTYNHSKILRSTI